jgi:hypothetical protein
MYLRFSWSFLHACTVIKTVSDMSNSDKERNKPNNVGKQIFPHDDHSIDINVSSIWHAHKGIYLK